MTSERRDIMGQGAARLGDSSTGHGCFGGVPSNSASANVKVNKKGAMRQGDTHNPHACPKVPPHVPVAKGGGTVKINGRKAHRKGDGHGCGDKQAGASSNVRFG